MDYQPGVTPCPQCRSSDQVRTARELFDMMNGARDQAFQRSNQFQQPGQTPGQDWNANNNDDYDHYNVEGSGSGPGSGSGRRRSGRRDFDFDFDLGDGIGDDLGAAVVGIAAGFAARALGKRMKRAFAEKVVPAMEARMAQAQQQPPDLSQQSQPQWEQSTAEQDAIVARYPELRGCLTDQVIFLDGGYKTVPVGELTMPVTLAQADAVVLRLR